MINTTSHAFPPQCRLKKPDEYKKVFANPIKSSDAYFTLLAMPNNYPHPRLGLAIAKKQIRKAVQRNRIKRTVRENFRKQSQLGNIDIVVLARKEAINVSLDLLSKSLEQHWQRLITRCATYSQQV